MHAEPRAQADRFLPDDRRPSLKDVRETWAKVLKERDTFSMKDTYDGQQLYEIHFVYAVKLEEAEKSDPEANLKHAKETIQSFLQ